MVIYYIYIFLYIYKNNNTIYNKPLLDKDLRSVPKFSKVPLFLHLKMSKLSFYNFNNNKILKCCFYHWKSAFLALEKKTQKFRSLSQTFLA